MIIKKHLSIYIIFFYLILLRHNGISNAGAKEMAQNFIHLNELKEFLLDLG
jgi:hypothetical protein